MSAAYRCLIRWFLILSGLCMPLMAQDDDPYAEALKRIEVALTDRAEKLNLSVMALTTLPPEIGQLANIETLFLGGNQLG